MSIKSPCIMVCTIDKKSKLCYGCARSIEEIRNWSSMSDEERDKIMGKIDDRMLTHFGFSRMKKPEKSA